MDSKMSTAAYVHRAGGSSSASSACTSSSSSTATAAVGMAGTNANGTGGGGARMAVIGVTRNVKLRRRGASGFGFSLRGGREYAAGFYVSDVVPGGEAHRNGLRVGDQILRVNGYPVEDAVHQEVALLAKNQQVLVLKIRSVGMIPVKDNPNDPVTWHMVQQQQQQLQFGDAVSNEIRIRVILGEKGRLGCGVCRGLVPGLTVQGTREGGPARAAGLKAGDIILWCNGQSLTDLPFERAIEVMRSSAVLDLVVNRPIVNGSSNNHIYDCPESLWGAVRGSSGYDSETSSLVGPSPPPPPPPMLHQQQMASSPQHRNAHTLMHPKSCNRNGRNCCPPNGSGPSDWGHMEQSQEWMRKQNNTTVIRISQNNSSGNNSHGMGISNPYATQLHPQHCRRTGPRAGPMMSRSYDDASELLLLDEEPLYDPVAPRDFECHDFDANPRDELDRRAEYRREHGIREQSFERPASLDDVFVKENGHQTTMTTTMTTTATTATTTTGTDGGSVVLGSSNRQAMNATTVPAATAPTATTAAPGDKDRKTVTTVEVHQACPPPAPSMPPPLPYKWPAETKPMNAMGMQMGSTMSMGSTGSTETESSLESSCGGKDTASTSSSLSTSSSCEQPASSVVSFASSIAAAAACGASGKVLVQDTPTRLIPTANVRGPVVNGTLGPASNNIPVGVNAAAKIPPPPPPIDLGTAITQELQRRAKQRSMNNATGQESMQQPEKPNAGPGGPDSRKPQNPEALRAQEQKVTHDKLMEEFKRAHQRMFSNAQQRNQAVEQQQNGEQTEEKRTSSTVQRTLPVSNGKISTCKTKADDAVEMQSIESFKLKDSASVRVQPKPPPTYFSSAANNGKMANGAQQNGGAPATAKPSAASSATTGKAVSKVAIRIGTYEAELKQPSKLGFLNQRNDNKSSSESPVASRLKSELVATLQRSNLRKKTEGVNDVQNSVDEASKASQTNAGAQGNVEKLANALNNKVTIRVNPEASNR